MPRSLRRTNRPQGLYGPRSCCMTGKSRPGHVPAFRVRVMTSESSAKRGPSPMPKTVRTMTCSVIACIGRWTAKSLPMGHRSIESWARSVMAWPYAVIRSPWNAGSIIFRWRRCSAPSSRRRECWPRNGLSTKLAFPACPSSAPRAKTSFTASGSATTTRPPRIGGMRSVKTSPKRSRHSSITWNGSRIQRTTWSIGCSVGPAGSAMLPSVGPAATAAKRLPQPLMITA